MQHLLNVDLKYSFKGHRGAVYTLCKDLNALDLLSAGSDGMIIRWQPNLSQDGISIASIPDKIFCLLSSQKQSTLYAGTLSGDLFCIQIDGSKQVRRFRFHSNSIYRLALWKDHLISIAADGIISLWNVEAGQWMHHLQLSSSKLRSMSIDELADCIYVGDGNGNLFVLSLPDFQVIDKRHSVHDKTVFSLLSMESDKMLLSGGIDARLKLWKPGFEMINELKAHWFAVNDIVSLEGTNYIATASRDKSIRIWQKQSMDLVKEISRPKFAAHSHSVNSLCWIKESQILFSAGDDGMIYGWHITY